MSESRDGETPSRNNKPPGNFHVRSTSLNHKLKRHMPHHHLLTKPQAPATLTTSCRTKAHEMVPCQQPKPQARETCAMSTTSRITISLRNQCHGSSSSKNQKLVRECHINSSSGNQKLARCICHVSIASKPQVCVTLPFDRHGHDQHVSGEPFPRYDQPRQSISPRNKALKTCVL